MYTLLYSQLSWMPPSQPVYPDVWMCVHLHAVFHHLNNTQIFHQFGMEAVVSDDFFLGSSEYLKVILNSSLCLTYFSLKHF